MNLIKSTQFIIISIFVTSFAYCQDFYGVEVHGFASQGYLKSDENNYLGNSKKGSFEFNEVGINFQKDLTDSLRVGLQLFARDLGSQGNNEVVIDWALLDYQWKNYFNVRIGKIKSPYGLYNQGRDIDLLRTPILLPQVVYNEPLRELIGSLSGISLYGNFDLNNFGSLEYDFQLGVVSVDPEAPFVADPYARLREGAKNQALAGFSGAPGFTGIESIEGDAASKMKNMVALQLIYNTPLEGFRVGATYNEITGQFDGDFSLVVNFANPNDPSGTLQISSISNVSVSTEVKTRIGVASLEYKRNRLTLSAELIRYTWYFDDEKVDANSGGGYYLSASYQFNDWFTLGAYYNEVYRDIEDSEIVALGRNAFQNWQKDFTLSARFDINEYWIVKAEFHVMNGAAQLTFNDNLNNTLEEDWFLFALKATVSF